MKPMKPMKLTSEQIAEAKERVGDEPLVLSVSGGKDSTATGLALIEAEMDFSCLHLDTGWEHPWTERYVREDVPRILGRPVEIRQREEGGMLALVLKKGMFPSRLRRFCTQELKVKPFLAYMRELEALGHDPVSVVGVRADESRARASLPEWDEQGGGFTVWRPLLRWSYEDVIAIHQRHGVKPNDLYLKAGQDRVGCWPCIFARKAELAAIATLDPGRIEEIRDLEEQVGAKALARLEERGETLESMDSSTPRFFRARARVVDPETSKKVWGRHDWPIDRCVDWALSRGEFAKPLPVVQQGELFTPTEQDMGCMRWGMCEVSA